MDARARPSCPLVALVVVMVGLMSAVLVTSRGRGPVDSAASLSGVPLVVAHVVVSDTFQPLERCRGFVDCGLPIRRSDGYAVECVPHASR